MIPPDGTKTPHAVLVEYQLPLVYFPEDQFFFVLWFVYGWMDGQMDGWFYTLDRQIDRQTNSYTARQPDRQTDLPNLELNLIQN